MNTLAYLLRRGRLRLFHSSNMASPGMGLPAFKNVSEESYILPMEQDLLLNLDLKPYPLILENCMFLGTWPVSGKLFRQCR